MPTEAHPKRELLTLKFSNTTLITDEELKKEIKKVTEQLDEIIKKKHVDYEKLKAVVKL